MLKIDNIKYSTLFFFIYYLKPTKKSSILIFILLPLSFLLSQTPQVVSISPYFNKIANDNNPEITITFDISMDSSSFDSFSFSIFGERTGYHLGEINYSEESKKVSFISSDQFNVGERVLVSLSNKIKSLQGDSLNGFSWTFRIPSKSIGINFSDPVEYGGGGYGMQCIDMNNNGSPDIVTSSGVILINDGSGKFPSYWTLNDPYETYPIIVNDFNRDGFMDVLYSGEKGIQIGIGDGASNFLITTKEGWLDPFYFYEYICADFNGDNFPDIAGLNGATEDPDNPTSNWSIAFNDGFGNFQDTIMYNIGGGGNPQYIIATDIDNDGYMDVVISSNMIVDSSPYSPYGLEGIIVCRNDGTGYFNDFQSYQNYGINYGVSFPKYLYSSDVNNDNYTDIAVSGNMEAVVNLNLGDGLLGTTENDRRFLWGWHQTPPPITAGDLNGDGWIDFAASGIVDLDQTSAFYYSSTNCNGYFIDCVANNSFNDSIPGAYKYAFAAADIDSDGDLDLIHCGDGVFITLNKDTVTSVNDKIRELGDFILYPNYPNPFNNETIINFEIKKSEKIKISIFNILGQEVRLLKEDFFNKGRHSIAWDGIDNKGVYLPSGVYIITAATSKYIKNVKAIFIK